MRPKSQLKLELKTVFEILLILQQERPDVIAHLGCDGVGDVGIEAEDGVQASLSVERFSNSPTRDRCFAKNVEYQGAVLIIVRVAEGHRVVVVLIP